MAFWLLKTEPDDYNWQELVQTGAVTWDGVSNAGALIHMRAMEVDDLALIYHTGKERAAVGIARVTRAAYPDPRLDDPRLVVVDLAPVQPLPQPVGLAAIKAEPALADWALVRQGRLSVVPCTPEQWQWVLDQAGYSA